LPVGLSGSNGQWLAGIDEFEADVKACLVFCVWFLVFE
jgi:hypothetical protein